LKQPRSFVTGLLLAAAAGCAQAPGGETAGGPAAVAPTAAQSGPVEPEGHRRMIALLDEIAARADVDNPFLGRLQTDEARAELKTLPDNEVAKRWFLNMYLGKNELRLGHNEVAVEHYVEANRLLGVARDPPPKDKVAQTLFETAVAYIRLGEAQNCVARHTSESCIFPIKGRGVHADKRGATAALEYLERVLAMLPPIGVVILMQRWFVKGLVEAEK